MNSLACSANGGERNPNHDITNYGARSVVSAATTTCSINSGSSLMILASGAGFQNGDSVRCDGAGPATSLATPSHLSVTSFVNAGGSTSVSFTGPSKGTTIYAYKVVACDYRGGCSAASNSTVTTMGNPTLGRITATTSRMSLSGNTLTVTTRAAHRFSPGAQVIIQYNSSNTALFEGFYGIASTPSATTFTVSVPFDSRVPGTPTSDTSAAEVICFNANHLQWTPVANAWKYVIYGRREGAFNYIGTTRPQENFFDDYGSPLMDNWQRPPYIPATAPAVPVPQYLLATITAGGGTTSLTVSPSASTTVSGSRATMGSDAAILAAFTAAKGGPPPNNQQAPIRIPAGNFFTAGYFSVPVSTTGYRIEQVGNLTLGDTFDITGSQISWSGVGSNSATAFQWETAAQIKGGGAFPMIYNFNNSDMYFSHLNFQDYTSNGGLIFSSGGATQSYDYVTLGAGGGPMSQIYVQRDGFSFFFHKVDFIGGQYPYGNISDLGYSFLPAVVFKASHDNGSSLAGGGFVFTDSWFVGRSGVEQNGSPAIPGDKCPGGISAGVMTNIQTQNMDIPLFIISSAPCVNPVVAGSGWYLTNIWPADYPTAVATSFSSRNGAQGGLFITVAPNSIQGRHNVYTGTPMAGGFTVAGASRENNNYGFDFGTFYGHPTYGNYTGAQFQVREQMEFSANHGLTWPFPPVAAPNVTSTTNFERGFLPQGRYVYSIGVVGPDGGQTIPGFSSEPFDADGSHNPRVSWTDVPGATRYIVYRNGVVGGSSCGATAGIVGNSCIDSDGAAGNSPPTFSGTGLPSIFPQGFYSQNFILASSAQGNHGFGTITGNFTSNRRITVPDASFTVAQLIAAGSSHLGTTTIAPMTCAPVISAPAADVSTGDAISFSFNAEPTGAYIAGIFVQSYVTPGKVNFLACNLTMQRLTPPAAILNWRVSR